MMLSKHRRTFSLLLPLATIAQTIIIIQAIQPIIIFPNIISVAATDHSDRLAWFSNFGSLKVHVEAPGENITSTLPSNSYGSYSGTSMGAAPHVTGLAALLKAQNPGRDGKTIKNLILTGGDNAISYSKKTISNRRINAFQSLSCQDRPLLSVIQYPSPISTGVPVTLSALSINCGVQAGPVTATTAGGEVITLLDNGVTPDIEAGDGIFSGTWTALRENERLIFASPAGTESVSIPSFSIATSLLPEGNVYSFYSQALEAIGGLPPYLWSLSSGSLPDGLQLNASTGEISGTPAGTGTFEFTVQATDAYHATATKIISILVVNSPIVMKWIKTYDNKFHDYAQGIGSDQYNNIYVTGYSHNWYDGEYLTIKYDSSGHMLWSRTYSNWLAGAAEGIAVDRQGNAYITGSSGYGCLTLKYDPEGNVMWDIIYKNELSAAGIVADGNGDVSVTGSTQNSATQNDYLTVKYDSSGNTLWDNIYDSDSGINDQARGIAIDAVGNVYITGTSDTVFQTFKYDPSGNMLWTLNDGGYDIAVDDQGNIYILGSSPAGFTIIKYDSSGTLLWQVPIGKSTNNLYKYPNLYGIATDRNGNVYATGHFYNDSSGLTLANYDVLTISYDSAGNLRWAKPYDSGNHNDDIAEDITVDKNGNIYITGYFDSDEINSNYLTIKYTQDNFFEITTTVLPEGTNGMNYSYVPAIAGGLPPYTWYISSGSLPNGLTINRSTGAISGRPTTGGTFKFTVWVNDANRKYATKPLSLSVYNPLTLTTSSLTGEALGTAYNKILTAIGGKAPYTWTLSSGSLPIGLTLNSSTGEIAGTPLAAGTYTFTVKVIDSNLSSATTQFTIQIAALSCPSSVRIARIPEVPLATLQSALNAASEGDAIQAQASEFTEDLTFSLPVAVTLKGGFDCDYTEDVWYTAVKGAITVNSGSLVIENIILQ